ncbi:uncharacterized protein LOC144468319 [Augochlora pura]
MGSEEGGDGMASVDAAASWQQYYTWCGPYTHPHQHPHPPSHGHPHSHPHFHHPSHLNQYQAGQYQQQSLAASTANTSGHYPTSQQYHPQLQPSQTPPLHQQQQFHPARGQNPPRRAAPYDRPGTTDLPMAAGRFYDHDGTVGDNRPSAKCERVVGCQCIRFRELKLSTFLFC